MLASENMDLQVVGCMDRTRLQNEIETKIDFFILEVVKIRRSPYARFNFTNLRINTDVLSPMYQLHEKLNALSLTLKLNSPARLTDQIISYNEDNVGTWRGGSHTNCR